MLAESIVQFLADASLFVERDFGEFGLKLPHFIAYALPFDCIANGTGEQTAIEVELDHVVLRSATHRFHRREVVVGVGKNNDGNSRRRGVHAVECFESHAVG